MTAPRTQRTEVAATEPLAGPAAGGPLQGAPLARVVLGRYRLQRKLGAGGFGVVWLAWDERLEREVAVKVIPREGRDARVEREARAAARLNHPGIVALYELASDEHEVYLVSELVRGRTFAELSGAGALADRDVARIGGALCDALDHAHARGVIHRDVKPQNVMVLSEPAAGAGFAKLTDFGVAHMASADGLTRTGDVVGTLAYMAPEQAEGSRVSPACDVYSLALTLYEAWTGRNPVRAAGPAATARRLGRPLPALGGARRDLPLELCEPIDEALNPDPALRPSPRALAAALRAAEPELADTGGLEEPATLARVGLQRARGWRGRRGPLARATGEEPVVPLLARVAARLGAGSAAALLVLAALSQLGPEPPFSALSAAGVAGLLVSLLPRLGWIAAAVGLCLWLASPEAGRQGSALVLALAAGSAALLLPRAGALWSVPVLAPLLGLVGLAPVFVALAALAPTALRRAGLAGAGFLWLALAEPVSDRALLFGAPEGSEPLREWQGSLGAAAGDVLAPLASSPALAPLAVWAAFALLLPLVVRGRLLALDALAAALWAAGLVAAHAALADLMAGSAGLEQARGAVAGAVGAALVALAVSRAAPSQEPWRAEPARSP
jgi:hypothetical protein